jgi:hypothetical protein
MEINMKNSKRNATGLALALGALSAGSQSFAQTMQDDNSMMMEGGMMMGPMGMIMMLLILLFLALGIAAFIKILFFSKKK